MTSADLVVIGGGIAGLTTALAAADRGLRVIVIDVPRPGAASRAAAGLLAPSIEGLPSGAREDAVAARDFYPGYLARLRDLGGCDVPLDRRGILELAEDDRALQELAARSPAATRLSASELAALEPALRQNAGAALHPHDGAVDTATLMSALNSAVDAAANVDRVVDTVVSIELSATPRILCASNVRHSAPWIVLAAGSWTDAVAGLPRRLPVRPVMGQLLSLGTNELHHVAYAPAGGYLVPRGNALIVGATSENTGLASDTSAAGREWLLDVVRRAAPALVAAPVLTHWAGLRPVSPDGLPILGPDPACPSLIYAAGFSRNGILFAPWAAERIAEGLVAERTWKSIDSFGVNRFDRH